MYCHLRVRCVHVVRKPAVRSSRTVPVAGRGFSLVELIAVLVIVAILASSAAPRYAAFLTRERLDAASRKIVADLLLAQRHAKFTGVPQVVRFEPAAERYRLVGYVDPDHSGREYAVTLGVEPYNVAINSATFGGDSDIIYNAWGMPDTSGSIVIQIGQIRKTVTVSGAGKFTETIDFIPAPAQPVELQ